MRAIPLLIVVSLTANLALGGWWMLKRTASSSNSDDPGMTRGASAPRYASKATHSTAGSIVAARAEREAIKSWADIQTEELKELVRRLRNVGCPDETVRDIILAEVNRRFQKRSRELWPERFEIKPYWQVQKNDPAESKRNRERYRRDRDIQKEKSALLVELLGVDPEKLRREDEGFEPYVDYRERQVAFLPESKREEVLKYMEEFEDKRQELYAQNRGLYDDQFRAEQKQFEAEQLAGLAKILTPQEVREYELRNSQLASQLSRDLSNLSLTRQQYEAIYDIRKKYGDSIYNYGDIEGQDAMKRVEATKLAMQQEIATSLGADMGRQYERSQDYTFQQLARLAKRYDLPAGTADKVYDFKSAAEASVKAINASTDLSNEQKIAARQEIRDTTEQTVKTTLGEDNFKKYQREGGYWMNSLSPTRRPVPTRSR